MEDQQPDPGDLTTAKTPSGKAARRRHRMPLRQELVASRDDTEVTPTDEAPEAGAAAVAEAGNGTKPRRGLFRRRANTVEPEPVSESDDAAEPEESEAEHAPAEDVVLVPYRPAGKRLTVAAVAAGVVFVGAAAFAGAAVQPYLADRALVGTKLKIARTAADAITTLWSYTPDNMDNLPDRSAGFLGGDFANAVSYTHLTLPTNREV